MQGIYASLGRKPGLKEEFEDLRQYHFESNPHGMAHDLYIALVLAKQPSLHCAGTQMKKDLCQFNTQE